jgi:hypothetical protein
MPETQSFLEAVEYANMRQPAHRSIVCNSIASAIRGESGDYHATDRTGSAELFVNPLMTLFWFYDIPRLSRWIGFYDAIRNGRRVRRQAGPVVSMPWTAFFGAAIAPDAVG